MDLFWIAAPMILACLVPVVILICICYRRQKRKRNRLVESCRSAGESALRHAVEHQGGGCVSACSNSCVINGFCGDNGRLFRDNNHQVFLIACDTDVDYLTTQDIRVEERTDSRPKKQVRFDPCLPPSYDSCMESPPSYDDVVKINETNKDGI